MAFQRRTLVTLLAVHQALERRRLAQEARRLAQVEAEKEALEHRKAELEQLDRVKSSFTLTVQGYRLWNRKVPGQRSVHHAVHGRSGPRPCVFLRRPGPGGFGPRLAWTRRLRRSGRRLSCPERETFSPDVLLEDMSLLPRIDNRYTCILEIIFIACNQAEIAIQGNSRNQRIYGWHRFARYFECTG